MHIEKSMSDITLHSYVMPDSDPWGGFFNTHQTSMEDSYNL